MSGSGGGSTGISDIDARRNMRELNNRLDSIEELTLQHKFKLAKARRMIRELRHDWKRGFIPLDDKFNDLLEVLSND